MRHWSCVYLYRLIAEALLVRALVTTSAPRITLLPKIQLGSVRDTAMASRCCVKNVTWKQWNRWVGSSVVNMKLGKESETNTQSSQAYLRSSCKPQLYHHSHLHVCRELHKLVQVQGVGPQGEVAVSLQIYSWLWDSPRDSDFGREQAIEGLTVFMVLCLMSAGSLLNITWAMTKY